MRTGGIFAKIEALKPFEPTCHPRLTSSPSDVPSESMEVAPGSSDSGNENWADRGRSIFAKYDGYSTHAFRNHCERLACFATLIAASSGISFETGAISLLAYVHDLGLLTAVDDGPSYMHRSFALLRRECADAFASDGSGLGLSQIQLQEILLLNHRVFPVPGATPQAEVFRRAVWIEHSRGVRRYGLSHSSVRAVFEKLPRLDLDRVLFDFAKRTVLREPVTIVRGIFF